MTNQFLDRAAFVVLLMFVCVGFSQAQFNETIRTGRPGQSINPYTTGKGVLQFQQGYVFESAKLDFDPSSLTFPVENAEGNMSLFENVIRYGIGENIEINAAVNYNWFKHEIEAGRLDSQITGNYLSAADIGARVHLADNKGLMPDIALQARLGMAQNGDEGDFEIQNVQVTAAFFWQLADKHGLTVNLIPIIATNDELTTQVNYTLAYGVSITDKIGVFIENYGSLYFDAVYNYFDTYFDAGVSYLVNNNVQLDLLGGYSKNKVDSGIEESKYFIAAGVSWRVLTAK